MHHKIKNTLLNWIMKKQHQLKLIMLIIISLTFQNCTKEETTTSNESNYGYLQFYQATDLGLGPLSVYINGTFEGTFSTIDPDGPDSSTCAIVGFSKKLEAGSYTWKVTNASGSVKWEDTTIVQKYGLCSANKLTNNTTTAIKYILDGQEFSCTCFTDNKGMVFLKDKNNSSNFFTIERMPSASSGTFNFGKNFTGNTVLPMGYLLESRSAYSGYGSESGTITKTGAREFTFQCTLYDPLKTTKHQISGSGKY